MTARLLRTSARSLRTETAIVSRVLDDSSHGAVPDTRTTHRRLRRESHTLDVMPSRRERHGEVAESQGARGSYSATSKTRSKNSPPSPSNAAAIGRSSLLPPGGSHSGTGFRAERTVREAVAQRNEVEKVVGVHVRNDQRVERQILDRQLKVPTAPLPASKSTDADGVCTR